ncbi:MAG: hypothetical protein ABIF10_05390 [Candidatus Woesearchaeota archaeon]
MVLKKRLVILLFVLHSAICSAGVSINLGKYDDYFLRVTSDAPVVYAEPGETVNFKMYIMRTDDPVVLHDVVVAGNDDLFKLDIKPLVVPEIRNIDAILLNAALTVPEDVVDGVYPLKIYVKGKEFVKEAYPLDTRIRVGPHTSLPQFLMLLATVFLISMIIYRIMTIKKR